jgi:hypothetical protein
MIRLYKERTGRKEVDMREVAKFAARMGWRLPEPISAIDRLARAFSDAAREEIRRDQTTGKPYRGQHVVWVRQGDKQIPLWIDIDEDHPRPVIKKSLMKRREGSVDDLVQLTFDAEHWNGMHPDQEPIVIPCDLGPDVQWRRNGDEQQRAG